MQEKYCIQGTEHYQWKNLDIQSLLQRYKRDEEGKNVRQKHWIKEKGPGFVPYGSYQKSGLVVDFLYGFILMSRIQM